MAKKVKEKPGPHIPSMDYSVYKAIIIKTEWNSHVTNELAEGCKRVLENHGVTVGEITVPGAVELTYAVHYFSDKGIMDLRVIIAIGCVIRGDTPHFDYVCQSVTQGITYLNATGNIPVIFGVLTVDNEQQALDRIGGKHGHKGEEAGMAALQMIAMKYLSLQNLRFGR